MMDDLMYNRKIDNEIIGSVQFMYDKLFCISSLFFLSFLVFGVSWFVSRLRGCSQSFGQGVSR